MPADAGVAKDVIERDIAEIELCFRMGWEVDGQAAMRLIGYVRQLEQEAVWLRARPFTNPEEGRR